MVSLKTNEKGSSLMMKIYPYFKVVTLSLFTLLFSASAFADRVELVSATNCPEPLKKFSEISDLSYKLYGIRNFVDNVIRVTYPDGKILYWSPMAPTFMSYKRGLEFCTSYGARLPTFNEARFLATTLNSMGKDEYFIGDCGQNLWVSDLSDEPALFSIYRHFRGFGQAFAFADSRETVRCVKEIQ